MEGNNSLKDLIMATGALCEMAGLLRDNLIRNGFTREEAVNIAGSYVVAVATGNISVENSED